MGTQDMLSSAGYALALALGINHQIVEQLHDKNS